MLMDIPGIIYEKALIQMNLLKREKKLKGVYSDRGKQGKETERLTRGEQHAEFCKLKAKPYKNKRVKLRV